MMIYTHIINTSLESNNENDGDAIELITYLFNLIVLLLGANILENIFIKQYLI